MKSIEVKALTKCDQKTAKAFRKRKRAEEVR